MIINLDYSCIDMTIWKFSLFGKFEKLNWDHQFVFAIDKNATIEKPSTKWTKWLPCLKWQYLCIDGRGWNLHGYIKFEELENISSEIQRITVYILCYLYSKQQQLLSFTVPKRVDLLSIMHNTYNVDISLEKKHVQSWITIKRWMVWILWKKWRNKGWST